MCDAYSTVCLFICWLLNQAWELRMGKSAEKWGPWGLQKAHSGGPGGCPLKLKLFNKNKT